MKINKIPLKAGLLTDILCIYDGTRGKKLAEQPLNLLEVDITGQQDRCAVQLVLYPYEHRGALGISAQMNTTLTLRILIILSRARISECISE